MGCVLPNKRRLFITVLLILLVLTLVCYKDDKNVRPASTSVLTKRFDSDRKRLVKKHCEKYRRTESVLDESVIWSHLDKFYVDDKHKFIYCHVPKVATTTWLGLLLRLTNHTANKPHKISHYMSLRKYNKTEALHRLRNYFKFVFVRDPLERLISAYRDKILGTRKGLSKIQQYAPGLLQNVTAKRDVIRFPEFIRYYIENTNSGKNQLGMWSSVTAICKPCQIDYDFIGHYETLGRDAESLLTKLGFGESLRFPSLRRSKTIAMVLYYYRQLTSEQQKLVHDRLREDYEIFGYTPLQ